MIVLIALAVPAPFLFSAQTGTLQTVRGKVEIKTPGGVWKQANAGDTILQGTTISTGFDGTAIIALGNTSVVEAKPLTRLTLNELIQKEGKVNTELFLDVGRVKAEVKSSEGLEHTFTLKSTVSTASVRGTTIEGDGEEWETQEGTCSVSNNTGQTVTVTQGQSTTVTGNAPPAPPQATMAQSTTVQTSTKPSDDGDDGGGGDDDDGGGGAAPPSVPTPTTTTVTITWD